MVAKATPKGLIRDRERVIVSSERRVGAMLDSITSGCGMVADGRVKAPVAEGTRTDRRPHRNSSLRPRREFDAVITS